VKALGPNELFRLNPSKQTAQGPQSPRQ